MLYRLPEVARDRHQALEERWAKGVWLGHARSTNAALIGTDKGVIKAWGFRRLPEGQQWDGDMIKAIRDTPKEWKLDVGEDAQQVEMRDGGIPYEGAGIEMPRSSRAGERRSMNLRRSDFERYGFSDGCPGCQDMAVQRPGPSSGWSVRTPACRKIM